MPWYARAVVLGSVAYALSPIDLIPDFIPVLGLLDDLILLPLGIYLALKLIPEGVMLESRQRAHEIAAHSARWGAFVVVCIWPGTARGVAPRLLAYPGDLGTPRPRDPRAILGHDHACLRGSDASRTAR